AVADTLHATIRLDFPLMVSALTICMATYLGRSGQEEGPVMQKTILLLISLWLSTTEAPAQTPFYQGKTITLIVGSGAGTAYDIYARLLGSYVGKYLP